MCPQLEQRCTDDVTPPRDENANAKQNKTKDNFYVSVTFCKKEKKMSNQKVTIEQVQGSLKVSKFGPDCRKHEGKNNNQSKVWG